MRFSSKLVTYILLIIIVVIAFQKHEVLQSKTDVIKFDVYGYYLYLPALFIHQDTDQYDFVNDHLSKRKIADPFYQLTTLDSGQKAPIYSGGMAMLYSPFFLVADLYAKRSHHERDGISFPYQLSILIATLFYIFLCLFFLRKIIAENFSDRIAVLTLLILVLGTNFFHHATSEIGLSNTILLGLYAPLFWVITKWHAQPNFKYSILIGFLSGLICLARPSEVVLVFLFLLFGVGSSFSISKKLNFLLEKWKLITLMIVIGILTILPQIVFWKVNLGLWIFNGYSEQHHFDFLAPHIWNGLFSYRKGWLLYNPIMIFAIAGIFMLKKQNKDWFAGILTFFCISVYVIFSWHMWWYSSSFGNRGIVQIYPIMGIGLAAFLSWLLSQRSVLLKGVIAFIITILLLFYQFQNYQYAARIIPQDKTTEFYYWKVFLKTKSQLPSDIEKYLYLNEEIPDRDWNAQTLDSIQNFEPKFITPQKEYFYAIKNRIDKEQADLLSENWVQVSTIINQHTDNFAQWKDLSLTLSLIRNKETIQWTSIPIQRFLENGKFQTFSFEKKLPVLLENDEIRAMFWNKSPDTLQVKEFKIIGLY